MIEYIVWSIRLWLVDYRERVRERDADLTYRYMTYGWPWRWLRDFVDRFASPFDPRTGYRRTFTRRWLWKLTHPGPWLRLTSLRWTLNVLDRFLPYIGPGKYDVSKASRALKIEWLDTHSEYATKTDGDVNQFGVFVMLFLDLDVPWSRSAESWILATDDRGFVDGFQPDDPENTFETYVKGFEGEDDIEDEFDDDEPGLGREGQPEFNGAFR